MADFKPEYTIQFLPNARHIELVPSNSLDFDGDSFGLEISTWEPILGRIKKVGIATDVQGPVRKSTAKKDITIHMAGMAVHLRPKVKSRFLGLTIGGITVNKANVGFDKEYDDERPSCQPILSYYSHAPRSTRRSYKSLRWRWQPGASPPELGTPASGEPMDQWLGEDFQARVQPEWH